MLPDSYTAVHRYDGAIIQRQRCDDPEPCSLRQRDLAIVRDVWRYHFLTTNQVRELWWPVRSVQAARRRLVKLFRAGLLERFRPYSPRMKSRRHPGAAAGDESTARHQYGPAVARVIPPPPAPSRERRTPPGRLLRSPYGLALEGDRPTELNRASRHDDATQTLA